MDQVRNLFETDPLLFFAVVVILGYLICRLMKVNEGYDAYINPKPSMKEYVRVTQGVYDVDKRVRGY